MFTIIAKIKELPRNHQKIEKEKITNIQKAPEEKKNTVFHKEQLAEIQNEILIQQTIMESLKNKLEKKKQEQQREER